MKALCIKHLIYLKKWFVLKYFLSKNLKNDFSYLLMTDVSAKTVTFRMNGSLVVVTAASIYNVRRGKKDYIAAVSHFKLVLYFKLVCVRLCVCYQVREGAMSDLQTQLREVLRENELLRRDVSNPFIL